MKKIAVIMLTTIVFGILLVSCVGNQEKENLNYSVKEEYQDVAETEEFKVMELEYTVEEQRELIKDYTDAEVLAYFLANHDEATYEEKAIIAAITVSSAVGKENFSEELRNSIITMSNPEFMESFLNEKPTEKDMEIAQKSIDGEIKTEYTSYMFLSKEIVLDMNEFPDSMRTENYIFTK